MIDFDKADLSLIEKQWLFMRLVPMLILKIQTSGYEISGGDLFRDPRTHGHFGQGEDAPYGKVRSVHKLKLAIDLNLFKDGKFLRNTEDHQQFGEWWESLHPLCRWGGRWHDGNHYSIKHDGYA